MRNRKPNPATALLMAIFAVTVPAVAHAGSPSSINHQGYVEVNGQPYDGMGTFYFALVDSSGNNQWTNDGSQIGNMNRPDFGEQIAVNDGVYDAKLGGDAMDNFPNNFFSSNPDLRLRVWFDDGSNGVQRLEPDQPLQAVPYAKHADIATQAGTVVIVPNNALPSTISVEQLNYSPPRTHILNIEATSFRPTNSGATYDIGPGVIDGDGLVQFIAPVDLPQGATMTSMTAFLEDDAPGSHLEVLLFRSPNDIGNSVAKAAVDSSGFIGAGSATDTSIEDPVIDNTQYTYSVMVENSQNSWVDFDQALYQVQIEYEITEAQ